MKTNPLDQLKGICEQLLFRIANLHKSFKQFFIETHQLISTFGKTPNLNLNQKNIKQLLFYGVKTAS